MPISLTAGQLTTVDTERRYELGLVFQCTAFARLGTATALLEGGSEKWVYVVNDPAAAVAWGLGDVICRLPASTTFSDMWGGRLAAATTPVAALSILGVNQLASVPISNFAWIMCKGKAIVKCGSGDIAADTAIVSGGSAAGKAKSGTIGTDDGAFFGFALEAETVNDTVFDAWINCLGSI